LINKSYVQNKYTKLDFVDCSTEKPENNKQQCFIIGKQSISLNTMKAFISLLTATVLIEIFYSCNPAGHRYDYVPLEEYKYSKANIQAETEVELLAFSGGKESGEKSVYYYQFMVRDKSTGDTLRILTPLISVDQSAGVDNKTYTTPLQYDVAKGITNAFYEPMDSSQNLLLQTESLDKLGKNDSSVNIEALMSKIDKPQFVVVNKSMDVFENPNYRTAIGVLNFKKIPW
jgi:hypothetical protein